MRFDPACVPHSSDLLVSLSPANSVTQIHEIAYHLRLNCAVLLSGLAHEHAETIVQQVAECFGLAESLEIQAGFATFHGHRENVGRCFMTVNKRSDFQVIPPHSEGTSFTQMQLASFFCFENNTDGGETILLRSDSGSSQWRCLRESVRRADVDGRALEPHESTRARMLYRVRLPVDQLRHDDKVLQRHATDIPGLSLFDVLAQPQPMHSVIAGKPVYTLWDSIGSTDYDLAHYYMSLLEECQLMRLDARTLKLEEIDNAWSRHVWHSGVDYNQLFDAFLSKRLTAGDLLLVNNMTWAHATANWRPHSGERRVAAAFA